METMNLSNSKTIEILGWMFLIASFFTSYGVHMICASIFFSAHFIIETLENKK